MKTLWKILRIGMLVTILGLMILGPVTSAQSERSEEDCEAIGRRLREMVENGELTREELEGLRRRMAVRRVLMRRRRSANPQGAISQSDADGMLTRVRGWGVDLLNKW